MQKMQSKLSMCYVVIYIIGLPFCLNIKELSEMEGAWTEWGPWSECEFDESLKLPIMQRQRKCYNHSDNCTKEMKICMGNSTESAISVINSNSISLNEESLTSILAVENEQGSIIKREAPDYTNSIFSTNKAISVNFTDTKDSQTSVTSGNAEVMEIYSSTKSTKELPAYNITEAVEQYTTFLQVLETQPDLNTHTNAYDLNNSTKSIDLTEVSHINESIQNSDENIYIFTEESSDELSTETKLTTIFIDEPHVHEGEGVGSVNNITDSNDNPFVQSTDANFDTTDSKENVQEVEENSEMTNFTNEVISDDTYTSISLQVYTSTENSISNNSMDNLYVEQSTENAQTDIVHENVNESNKKTNVEATQQNSNSNNASDKFQIFAFTCTNCQPLQILLTNNSTHINGDVKMNYQLQALCNKLILTCNSPEKGKTALILDPLGNVINGNEETVVEEFNCNYFNEWQTSDGRTYSAVACVIEKPQCVNCPNLHILPAANLGFTEGIVTSKFHIINGCLALIIKCEASQTFNFARIISPSRTTISANDGYTEAEFTCVINEWQASNGIYVSMVSCVEEKVPCTNCPRIVLLSVNNPMQTDGIAKELLIYRDPCSILEFTCTSEKIGQKAMIINSENQILAEGEHSVKMNFTCDINHLWLSPNGDENKGIICAIAKERDCSSSEWSGWQSWSSCSSPCGACGVMTRSRTCITHVSQCHCIGIPHERAVCNRFPCHHPNQMCCNGFTLGAVDGRFECIPMYPT